MRAVCSFQEGLHVINIIAAIVSTRAIGSDSSHHSVYRWLDGPTIIKPAQVCANQRLHAFLSQISLRRSWKPVDGNYQHLFKVSYDLRLRWMKPRNKLAQFSNTVRDSSVVLCIINTKEAEKWEDGMGSGEYLVIQQWHSAQGMWSPCSWRCTGWSRSKLIFTRQVATRTWSTCALILFFSTPPPKKKSNTILTAIILW